MARRKDGREVNWGDAGTARPGRLPAWTEQQRAYVFKEIPELTFRTAKDDDEVSKADEGLYGLWYRFLRANPQCYPPSPDLPADDPRAALHAKFGDLAQDFPEWWMCRGRELFKEAKSLPFVRVLATRRATQHDRSDRGNHTTDKWPAAPSRTDVMISQLLHAIRREDADQPLSSLIIEIPMTISRELINRQLKDIFEAYHPGDDLRRHRFSSAQVRIHARRRYDQPYYEKLLAVWVHRQRQPEETWWQTGVRAKVDPSLDPHCAADPSSAAANKAELGRVTRALHEQAERMMWHALRGRFPCDDPVEQPPAPP